MFTATEHVSKAHNCIKGGACTTGEKGDGNTGMKEPWIAFPSQRSCDQWRSVEAKSQTEKGERKKETKRGRGSERGALKSRALSLPNSSSALAASVGLGERENRDGEGGRSTRL